MRKLGLEMSEFTFQISSSPKGWTSSRVHWPNSWKDICTFPHFPNVKHVFYTGTQARLKTKSTSVLLASKDSRWRAVITAFFFPLPLNQHKWQKKKKNRKEKKIQPFCTGLLFFQRNNQELSLVPIITYA